MSNYDVAQYGSSASANDDARENVIDHVQDAISATDDGYVRIDLSEFDADETELLTDAIQKHLTTIADWAREQDSYADDALVRITASDDTHIDSVALSQLSEQDEDRLVEIEAKVQDIYDQQVNFVKETWICQNGHTTPKWHYRWEDDLANPMSCIDVDCNATPYRRLSQERNTAGQGNSSQHDTVRINTQQMVLGEQGKDDRESVNIVGEVDEHMCNVIERADDITVWALPKVTDQGTFYLHVLGYRNDGGRGIEVTDKVRERVEERAENAPIDIVEHVSRSIAPHIVSRGGHSLARKGVALAIASAPEDLTMRSRINVCLYGPPAVGKSDIAESAVECADIGTFVDGKNSSATGLTVGLEDNSDLNGNETKFVAAGVFPQHDGGVVGIDEMDKMHHDDRQALLNPMTSGSVTYEKVKNVELEAKVSVIGTANPEDGYFDPAEAPVSQLELGRPMKSRFDLILPIHDTVSKNIEEEKDFISEMGRRKTGEKRDFAEKMNKKELREHFAVASSIEPQMTDAAQSYLDETHAKLRTEASNSKYEDARVTNRKYDALIRLSYAHARLRLSDTVTMQDAKAARDIVLESWSRLVDNDTVGVDEGIASLVSADGVSAKTETVREATRAVLALEDISGNPVKIDSVAKATSANQDEVEEAIEFLENKDMLSINDDTVTIDTDVEEAV